MALKVKNYQVILIIALAIFAFLIYRAVKFFTTKPNIAVNYAAELNKILKPENYDPNQNAYFDYEGAAAYIVENPTIMYKESWPDWPGDMNEAQLKILKDWINDNSKALEYFRKGSQKPYYWDELPENIKIAWGIPLPMLAPMRRCTQAACWRAKLNAFENKPDEALEDILTCYRAGILMSGKKSTSAEQLVGSALESLAVSAGLSILSNSNVDSEKLADFQSQFESIIQKEPKKITCTGAKMFMYDLIQRIFTDDGNGSGRLIPREAGKFMDISRGYIKPRSRSFFDIIDDVFSGASRGNNEDNINVLLIALNGPDRKQHIEAAERVYKFFEDIQDQSLGQIHNQGIDIEKQMNDMLTNYQLFKKMVPSLLRAIELNHRRKASEDAFLTVIAAFRFKAQKGNFPESLQELVDSGFLKELTMDPYSDGPLSYKKTEDGFLLYSFAEDFDDDGGTYSIWGQDKDGGDQVFWPLEKKTK